MGKMMAAHISGRERKSERIKEKGCREKGKEKSG